MLQFSFYFIFTLFISIVFFFKIKSNRVGLFLLFILFYFVAFRGENVGHDTVKYLNPAYIANWAQEADLATFEFDDLGAKVELLSGLLFKAIIALNLDSRWVLIVYSFIMVLFLYFSCRRFKTRIPYVAFFFVLFGFYFYSMSAARQFAAIPVVLYAMTFLQDGNLNKIKFLFWIIIAIFIHSFSIICLPLFFIDKFPQKKFLPVCVYLLSLALVLIKIDFINQLSMLISVDKISDYMTSDSAQAFSPVRILGYWIEISVFVYFFYRKKKYDLKQFGNSKFNNLDKLYLLSILLYAFFFQYDGLIGRARYNFCIIQCIFLASYFQKVHLRNYKDVIAFLCLFILRLLKNDAFIVALESNYYLA